mmetsp:Transcript_34689/g.81101  ORF Transcript_34689/g.81101 Transcript_34689/m.81101 type:complete len:367 (-) Transcript_34689:180-1280(-)
MRNDRRFSMTGYSLPTSQAFLRGLSLLGLVWRSSSCSSASGETDCDSERGLSFRELMVLRQLRSFLTRRSSIGVNPPTPPKLPDLSTCAAGGSSRLRAPSGGSNRLRGPVSGKWSWPLMLVRDVLLNEPCVPLRISSTVSAMSFCVSGTRRSRRGRSSGMAARLPRRSAVKGDDEVPRGGVSSRGSCDFWRKTENFPDLVRIKPVKPAGGAVDLALTKLVAAPNDADAFRAESASEGEDGVDASRRIPSRCPCSCLAPASDGVEASRRIPSRYPCICRAPGCARSEEVETRRPRVSDTEYLLLTTGTLCEVIFVDKRLVDAPPSFTTTVSLPCSCTCPSFGASPSLDVLGLDGELQVILSCGKGGT